MSRDATNNSARLDVLEALIAHQDRTIAELSDVVAAQWRKIDSLERQMTQLRDAVQSLPPLRDGPETPPPHY